ncbi:hypothetical protein ABT189_37705 [Streptomyces sp900105755]|uniref:hypothetical protein n=1 Tax=Streptomyces sp. 900105755 TaxID=3154389 RepID=UPI003319DA45
MLLVAAVHGDGRGGGSAGLTCSVRGRSGIKRMNELPDVPRLRAAADGFEAVVVNASAIPTLHVDDVSWTRNLFDRNLIER